MGPIVWDTLSIISLCNTNDYNNNADDGDDDDDNDDFGNKNDDDDDNCLHLRDKGRRNGNR